MITANRGGHNYQAQGAGGYVNEVVEDRKINSATIKHLKTLGHNPNDVTPGNCDSTTDLIYGVQTANNMDVDIFNSNHLNACYTTDGAMGCECVTYGDAPSVEIADRVRDNLVKLGFKYRENKVNKELYEVRAVVAPSVIVESFFCDSYADVQNYYRVGADEIGRAIAYGLVGKEFNIENNTIIEVKVEYEMKNLVCYGNGIDKRVKGYLEDALQCGSFDASIPSSEYDKIENVIAIGGAPSNFKKFSGYTKYHIQGADRFETGTLVIAASKRIAQGEDLGTVLAPYKIKK
ncbi:N-acetylmuramoyl-L-alanine amidase [Clostridium gasigenes]|uniref:N-acetylmuramoyl-L-alanine amidase n=1 Tax=Clostridium gasigenes TaxID=94869 RepID=UPI00162829E5|nr:N-acetylmuramoyl-L-alanine amidase [Clostridium gasigenes]MBB6622581.1 N-acetylmuramoyl-L-alanine amidase [Clostridium gasigenes]